MKTNHRRGFKAGTHRDQAGFNRATPLPLSDKSLFVYIGNDFTDGNRGMAKSKRGAKKFLRSRTRFHENSATKTAATEQIGD